MITNEIKATVRTIGIGLFLLCFGFQAFADDNKKADDSKKAKKETKYDRLFKERNGT